MAVKHILRKIFSNFRGLDKRSSHLTRTSEFAVEAKNVRYRKSGAISKRKGSHITAGNHKGGYGVTTFKKVDPTSGVVEDEIILVGQDNKLYKLSTGTLTLTVNSNTLSDGVSNTIDNSTKTYFVSIYPDAESKGFRFKLTWEDETILDYNLGSGLTTDSPTINNGPGSLDDLVEYINQTLVGAGSCTVTTSTSVQGISWQESSHSNSLSNYTYPSVIYGTLDYTTHIEDPSTGSIVDAAATATHFGDNNQHPLTLNIMQNQRSSAQDVTNVLGKATCQNGSNGVYNVDVSMDTCMNNPTGDAYYANWVEENLPNAHPIQDASTQMWHGDNYTPISNTTWTPTHANTSNTYPGTCSDSTYNNDIFNCLSGTTNTWSDVYSAKEHWRDWWAAGGYTWVPDGMVFTNTGSGNSAEGTYGGSFDTDGVGIRIRFNNALTNDISPALEECRSPIFTAPSNVPSTGNFKLKFKYKTSLNYVDGDFIPQLVRVSPTVQLTQPGLQTLDKTANSTNYEDYELDITNDGNWANATFEIRFRCKYAYSNSAGSFSDAQDRWADIKDIEILFQAASSSSTSTTTNYSTDQKLACEFNGVGAGNVGVWNSMSAGITGAGDSTATKEVKAAFLDTVKNAEVAYQQPLVLNVNYVSEIPRGDAGYQGDKPFTIYGSQTISTELENATFAQLNNVLYISNGYDELMKYDGDKVYRAGLPKPATAPTITSISSTGNVGLENNAGTNYYFYKYTYEYTDALGNIVSSEPSPVGKYQAGSAWEGAKVTYSNIQPGTGFNVDTPDKIKIKIYRTKKSETETTEPGAIYYLVNSFTTPLTTTAITGSFANSTNTGIDNGNIYNDKTSATSEYVDFLEDYATGGGTTTFTTNEFLTYSNHIKRHDLPPKGKYITAFQDCLVSTGQNDNVNNLAFSLPFNVATGEIGSEYFPSDDNQELVESRFGSKITAIAPLKDILYVFHKNSIHTLSGSITEGTAISYQVDLLTSEGGIGCEAHNAVEELQGNLFFLSTNGIYSINNSTAFPNEVSLVIQPEFKEIITTFNMKKAVAFNWVKENSIIFILPVEQSVDDNYLTTTEDSKIFVFDYSRQAWLEWDNLDFSGGITESKGTIYFSSRSLDLSNNFASYLYKMQDNKNTYDYADGVNPIPFKYKTSWESIDEPTIPKKFLRLKAYAFDADNSFESPSFVLNANIQKNYINQNTGSIPLDFGGASSGGWGIGAWGVSSWGSQILDAMKTKLPSGKSKSLAVSFENNALNENVLMSGYEMEIAGPYKKEIKE